MPSETAFYALAFAVLVQTAAVAYAFGRLSQRVKTLEDDGSGHSSLAVQFAEFKGVVTARLEAGNSTMEGLRKDLSWLTQTARPHDQFPRTPGS